MIFFGGRRDRDEDDSESGILGGIGGIIGKIFGGLPTIVTPSPILFRICSGLGAISASKILCRILEHRQLPFTGKEVFFHVNCEFT